MILAYAVITLLAIGFLIGTEAIEDPLALCVVAVLWPVMVPIALGCALGQRLEK